MATPAEPMVAIKPFINSTFETWRVNQSKFIQQWIQDNRFNSDPGTICFVPDAQGKLSMVLLGVSSVDDFWVFGDLPLRLPEGNYFLDVTSSMWPQSEQWQRALIAWGLGSYCFNRYQKRGPLPSLKPQLLIPQWVEALLCHHIVESLYWVRDLINTPTEDMGPAELTDTALQLTKMFNCKTEVIVDEDLAANYPAIYAVGKGSTRAPCLIDLRWGEPNAPRVTLVGKGVCFDSGGLNLKSADGMRYMKKDMAGAAYALGLARLIMLQKLPIYLHVLIPVAENMVAGNSYRPGDILTTRAGLSVEVTNTDAEGRLVLCDALTSAISQTPDLLIDFSTLTGAARVALGPDLPAFFTNNETLAKEMLLAGEKSADPLWRLPLYQPYERYLRSEVADLVNSPSAPHAGAILAALFLKQFVPNTIPWAHFDLSAWNFERLPGRPVGGEANALRAVFMYLQNKYCQKE